MIRLFTICFLFISAIACGTPPPPTVTSDLITKGPWVDVRGFSSLSTAAAYAIDNNKPLHITTKLTITSDTDLSLVPEIDVIQGGGFDIASGKTLQLPANFHAGQAQVFWATGAVTGLPIIRPEWFGGLPDGITDNSPIWAKFVNQGRPIKVSSGNYNFNTSVVITSKYLDIQGDSKNTSILSTQNGIVIFNHVADYPDVKISEVWFKGNSSVASSALHVTSNLGGSMVKMNHIRIGDGDTKTNSFGADAVYITDAIDTDFTDCRFEGPYSDTTPGTTTTRTASGVKIVPVVSGFTTTVSFNKCLIENFLYGVNSSNPYSYSYKNVIFQNNFIGLYNWRDTTITNNLAAGIVLESVWFEGNLNSSYGGALFQSVTDPNNVATTVNNVSLLNIYMNAPGGRDKVYGLKTATLGGTFLPNPSATPIVIASAPEITPPAPVFHVSGTELIYTINAPELGFTGFVTLIPDDIFTTSGSGGNIEVGSTAVINKPLTMYYDGNRWYPSY